MSARVVKSCRKRGVISVRLACSVSLSSHLQIVQLNTGTAKDVRVVLLPDIIRDTARLQLAEDVVVELDVQEVSPIARVSNRPTRIARAQAAGILSIVKLDNVPVGHDRGRRLGRSDNGRDVDGRGDAGEHAGEGEEEGEHVE